MVSDEGGHRQDQRPDQRLHPGRVVDRLQLVLVPLPPRPQLKAPPRDFGVGGQVLGDAAALGAGLGADVVHPPAVIALDVGADLDGIGELHAAASAAVVGCAIECVGLTIIVERVSGENGVDLEVWNLKKGCQSSFHE